MGLKFMAWVAEKAIIYLAKQVSDRLSCMRVAMLLLLAVSAVKAEVLVSQYRQQMKPDNKVLVLVTRQYVKGLGEGIEWVNTLLKGTSSRPLYCLPEIALTDENFLQILDSAIAKMSKTYSSKAVEESPIGLVLLTGLVETFPCPPR